MENAILDVKYATPPHSGVIDLSSDTWLNKALRAILSETLRSIGDQRTKLSRANAEERRLLAEIMRSIVFVTINYAPVSRIAGSVSRVSSTLANLEAFRAVVPGGEQAGEIRNAYFDMQVEELTPIDLVFFDSDLRAVGDGGAGAAPIASLWRKQWKQYLAISGKRNRFTLNQLLLQHAAHPRPMFVSWASEANRKRINDRAFASPSPASTFCDAAIHIDPVNLSTITRRARNVFVGANSQDQSSNLALDHFCDALSAMGVSAPSLAPTTEFFQIDRESVIGALMALQKFFGIWGGGSFFSIPVSLSIPATDVQSANATPHQMTAVISVCMKPTWDEVLHVSAWRFFSGIANQVVTDLLVHEHYLHTRMRWEESRTNVIYKVTHPIKNQLNRTRQRVELIDREVLKLAVGIREGTFSAEDLEAQLEVTRETATRARIRAARASDYFHLLNLMGDLMDEISVTPMIREAVDESIRLDGPTSWLDLTAAIARAAARASDKIKGMTNVRLEVPSARVFIPRRFLRGPLKRHSEMEADLMSAVFDELFENIANYGAKGAANRATAEMELRQIGPRWAIEIQNCIGAHCIGLSRGAVAQPDEWAIASSEGNSGLSLMTTLLRQLQLGQLRYRFTEPGPGEGLWTYQIVLAEACRVEFQ